MDYISPAGFDYDVDGTLTIIDDRALEVIGEGQRWFAISREAPKLEASQCLYVGPDEFTVTHVLVGDGQRIRTTYELVSIERRRRRQGKPQLRASVQTPKPVQTAPAVRQRRQVQDVPATSPLQVSHKPATSPPRPAQPRRPDPLEHPTGYESADELELLRAVRASVVVPKKFNRLLLNQLKDRGLVRQKHDPQRGRFAYLTREGQRLLEEG